jgi:hypothetical protein
MRVTPIPMVLALFGAWLASASAARAATVVLVKRAHPGAVASEATVRLSGELAAEGFEVRVVEAPDSDDPRATLEKAASGEDVEAVVAILAGAPTDAIELWVIDRVTGKTVIRSVPAEPATARSAEVLSIRALELLRASFLEIALGASRAASPSEPPAPPTPPEVTRMTEVALEVSWPRSWAIEVGGCLLGSFEGVPLSVAPVLRGERVWQERVVARVTLAGLGTRARVEGTAGSASIAQEFGLVELGMSLRRDRGVRPFFSVGAGALHLVSDGQTSFPYRARSGSLWTPVADAGVGARFALRGRFEVALEVHAQLARRYPTIQFAGETVARSGRPTVIGSLTLVAWL